MGKAIDEYIKRMGDIRSNYDRWSMLGLTPNEAKAFDMAIDTMRKYQQIEQIVNAELEEYHPLDRNPYRLALIKEVIEDGNGNDDN